MCLGLRSCHHATVPKPAHDRTRPRIGDVIEIETPKGLAYAHYTHEHRGTPRHGSLLRVLPGLYETRPFDFAGLVDRDERFSVFFPLGAATNRNIVRIVANEAISETKRPFPIFRSRMVSRLGVAGPWWIWDGNKERLARRRDRWTPRAIHAVWNDTLLIERIASGWSPDDDPMFSADRDRGS
jgi:hypothetical protein